MLMFVLSSSHSKMLFMYKNKPTTHTHAYHFFKTIWLSVCMLYFQVKSVLGFFLFCFALFLEVQNSPNQSKPLPSPIYHDKTTARFQPCITQKVEKWSKSTFLPPLSIPFHTTHQVKLCFKSLNGNLRAISLLEMGKKVQNIMISTWLYFLITQWPAPLTRRPISLKASTE